MSYIFCALKPGVREFEAIKPTETILEKCNSTELKMVWLYSYCLQGAIPGSVCPQNCDQLCLIRNYLVSSEREL